MVTFAVIFAAFATYEAWIVHMLKKSNKDSAEAKILCIISGALALLFLVKVLVT